MATAVQTGFAELVQLSTSDEHTGARTLWVPLREQFEREGPDAAREYLLAQRQQLADQVVKLLEQVDERLHD